MSTEIVTGASVALSLYENRQSIHRTLRRLRRSIQSGTWKVPVFGAGGTGKTRLGKFLAGEIDTDIAIPRFRESIVTEQFSMPGSVPAIFLVSPGQKRRRPSAWHDLFRLMSKGKARGVINVVSWGYHSTGIDYKRHQAYDSTRTPEQNLDAFLDYNRREETSALDAIVPHLRMVSGKFWMITLVTKQDLWWRERESVVRHYQEGEYGARIADITAVKGSEEFVHMYFFVSLVPQNLTTRDGTKLAITTAGYDQPLRVKNLHEFLEGLNEMLDR